MLKSNKFDINPGLRLTQDSVSRLMVLFIIVIVFMLNSCAVQHPLTIADIEPSLAKFDIAHQFGITDEDGFIVYFTIGNDNFDQFFRTAAKLDGLVLITKSMTTSATGQLKKYAMSKAADEALKESIYDLVGDTSPEDYTTEQSFAVMRLADQKGKVSSDERKYFATTSLSLGVGVYALIKSIGEIRDLLKDGATLVQNIPNLEPWLIPAATKAVSGSINNLKSVKENAPVAIEEMKVLYEGFKALKGE